jgi:predicted PilT family ATPase
MLFEYNRSRMLKERERERVGGVLVGGLPFGGKRVAELE